jgi:hypothetical protein
MTTTTTSITTAMINGKPPGFLFSLYTLLIFYFSCDNLLNHLNHHNEDHDGHNHNHNDHIPTPLTPPSLQRVKTAMAAAAVAGSRCDTSRATGMFSSIIIIIITLMFILD